jgi:hypothetical protein
MQGWIKLHRKLLENPIVCKDSDHLAVWVYLLLNATHEAYPALFKGKKITLEPGQLITGRKSISSKLSVSESKVKRILIELENDQQIDRQRSNQNSLISILNWDKYQECDQQDGHQMTSKRPASDQPVTTNKNVKNVKNEKKDIYSELPTELHEPLKRFLEHRKKLKKPMTDYAIELMLKKLIKLSGGDVRVSKNILEQSIERGWAGIFEIKNQASTNPFKDKLKEMVEDECERSNGCNVGYQGGLSKLLQGPSGD